MNRLRPHDLEGFDEEHYERLTRGERIAYTHKLRYSEEERRSWQSKGGKAEVPKGFAKLKKKELREVSARGGRRTKNDNTL